MALDPNDDTCCTASISGMSIQFESAGMSTAHECAPCMQALQSMPVIAAPSRAVEAAPAPWPASPEEEAVLIVPAQQELLPLQPSKLAVYKLFTEQVRQFHYHRCLSSECSECPSGYKDCFTFCVNAFWAGCLLCW